MTSAQILPWLATVAAWLTPTPQALLKGALAVQPTVAEIKTAFADFQGLVKVFAPILPGADSASKAAALDAKIDPVVDAWLASVSAPAEVVTLVNAGIDWAITFELNAVAAPAAA